MCAHDVVLRAHPFFNQHQVGRIMRCLLCRRLGRRRTVPLLAANDFPSPRYAILEQLEARCLLSTISNVLVNNLSADPDNHNTHGVLPPGYLPPQHAILEVGHFLSESSSEA